MNFMKWTVAITLFLTPLFFLTLTPNMFATPKQLFIIAATLVLLLAWGINTFKQRQLAISTSPLRFALLAFGLVLGLNVAMNPEARLESLIGPASLYLALSAWAYFMTFGHGTRFRETIIYSTLASTTVLALHNLLQLTLFSRLHFLPAFMQARSFTLTGNPLVTFTLIAIGTVLALALVLRPIHKELRLAAGAATILGLVSLIALGGLLLPGQELAPTLLPYSAAWNIALDALKNVRTLFFGVGLANFTVFYKQVKPLFLNSTVFWNNTPGSSSSELLQILTTTGVLGLLAFLAIPLVTLCTRTKQALDQPLLVLTGLSGLALIATPGSIPVLVIFFTSIGALASSTPKSREITLPLSIGLALIALIAAGAIGFGAYRIFAAETHLHNAQIGLSQNDGKKVYEETLAAIRLAPGVTSYRLSYSQVNLSIAGALSQKPSLSDEERQNVTTLVSQAIREGKLATSLRPSDAVTWQNLGALYRNLINVADGSDKFAVEAYAQAVALDPASPALRLEFGGLLYQVGQNTKKPEDQAILYGQAQREFQTAIQLKPDYANAYYNLAKLLETTKDYQNSYLAMQKSISLLGPDSPDLARVTTELDALKTKLPKATPAPEKEGKVEGTTLAVPSPLPSPLPGGPIELPASN